MARLPRNVVAVTPGGDITKDMILGFVALTTVPDTPVSAAKLRKLWLAEGLDENLVPKSRKAVNAFQVACRSVETRRHSETSDKMAEVKVDEVLNSETACVYQITHMVRDKDNEVIEHEKSMRVTFNKESESIKTEKLDAVAYKALSSLAQDIKDHYEKNGTKVPGSKVRAALRAILDGLGAQNLRRKSGGVYFIPRDGHSTLESLQRVLNDLYSEDADLHLIPLANAESEREMVERHFTINVRDELNELMADVATRLRDDKEIRIDRLRNIINRRRELEQYAERYRTLLDTDLTIVGESGRLLDEQIEALATKVGASL